MEATQDFNSKKRRRSYNPFIGILTRSKSQIYLHSNRSGRSRTDTILRSHTVGFQIQSSCNKKLRIKSVTQASADDDAEDWSKLLIKDLRAKRVFSLDDCGLCLDTEEKNGSEIISGEFQNEISPDSMNSDDMKSDCFINKESENTLDLDIMKEEANELGDEDDNASNEEFVQATPPDAEIFNPQKTEARQCINDQNMANNSEPNSGPYPWSRVKVFKTPGSLGYRRMLPFLKDMVQDNASPGTDTNSVSVERNCDSSVLLDSQKDSTVRSPTLPVDVGCSTPTVDEVREKIKIDVYREDQNLETLNPHCSTWEEKPMNGSSNWNNTYSTDNIMNNTRSKVGLNPCSRLKLFKAESSFSYRRLLPYLSNIAKDNSVDSGNEHCIKFEKRLEEAPVSKLSESEREKIPLEKINGKSHNAEHDTASCTVQMDISLATKVSSSTNQQSLMPSALRSRAGVSMDAKEEPKSQVVDVTSDHKDAQLDNSLSIMGLVNESSRAIMPLSEDKEENSKTLVAKIANDAEPVHAGCLSQTSSKIEATDSMGILGYDSKKGILKKHPRGCRGLCTCLNCASFRLHAERAFEFSKNQMQDAEEITLDLIKELSYLRNTLEKAAVGSDGQLVVCINQVKKACEKATEAEEIAKTRLSQMNYDLDIHCRITCGDRPRVRFSNNVEERIISEVNSKK